MSIPKFDPKELEGATVPGFFGTPMKTFNYPVSPKEAYRGAYQKKAVWQITGSEQSMFAPAVNPDNIARAFVYEANRIEPSREPVKDMFGIEWEYVPSAGGSIVRPGKPFIEDANEIMDKVVWPDVDKWDWEASAKANNGTFLKDDKFNVCWFLNGWFERLISFMDFEGAILALIDEEQKDAVKDFFEKLSNLYIKIFEKFCDYFPQIDAFCIHDDWGSQKECFFNPSVGEEMIVPYMKKVTDYLHSRGKFCDLHSCGQLLKAVPNMIKAGWDSWSGQAMNDTRRIYELYGDKILLGVIAEAYDVQNSTEEEQRAKAREYADRFCKPDKPSIFSYYGMANMTPAYAEELYKQSRINYAK